MKEILRQHHISFKNALSGVKYAFFTQPNFRVHLFLSTLAVIGAKILSISNTEMIIIIFTIVLGIAGEMINTAIESVTDLVTTEWRKEAKISKDVSAGMMLCISIGAFAIACVIFLPYIFDLI